MYKKIWIGAITAMLALGLLALPGLTQTAAADDETPTLRQGAGLGARDGTGPGLYQDGRGARDGRGRGQMGRGGGWGPRDGTGPGHHQDARGPRDGRGNGPRDGRGANPNCPR